MILRSLIRHSIQLLFTTNNNKQSNLTTTIHLHNHHHLLLRFLHKPIPENPQPINPHDFTVSYLINSCGLSPQAALSIANKIKLKSAENPEFLLSYLRSNGVSHTLIANSIRKCPQLLSINFEKNIKPKLEYFCSVGFSDSDLATLVSAVPDILRASLKNRLIPNFELLFSIIGNNQQISAAVRINSGLLRRSLETNFLPNVRTLQSCGIPHSSIAKLVIQRPIAIMKATEEFKATVQLIKEMGFKPLSTMFVHGVAVASRFNPAKWDKKVAFIKSLGWSDRDIILAFARHPFFMAISEVKFKKMMEFYGHRLQWGPSVLSSYPVLMSYSLEKRVMPRVSVMSMLVSKGLVTFNSTATFLTLSEKDFLNKYVTTYKNQVPELLETYKGYLETVGLVEGSTVVKGS